jgi:hypothetical protein
MGRGVVVEMKPMDPCTRISHGCSPVSFSYYLTEDMLAAEDCNSRKARQETPNKVVKYCPAGFDSSHFSACPYS